MNRRRTAGISAAVAATVLAMAAPASAGEELLTYLSKGKIKVAKKVRYEFVCAADCQVTATSTVLLKGPNVAPVISTGQFAAGEPVAAELTMNKSLRNSIKEHVGAAKLRTQVRATNTVTGETDKDSRTFRFKK